MTVTLNDLSPEDVIYIGIDPGLTGAAAIITTDKDDNLIGAGVIDFESHSSGNLSVLETIRTHLVLFGNTKAYAALERYGLRPGQNISAVGKYIANYGQWLGRLEVSHIPTTLVAPQSWQSHYQRYINDGLIDLSSFKKPTTKDASLEIARYIFPELAAKDLKLKKHHNRADALLLADFLRKHKTGLEFILKKI